MWREWMDKAPDGLPPPPPATGWEQVSDVKGPGTRGRRGGWQKTPRAQQDRTWHMAPGPRGVSGPLPATPVSFSVPTAGLSPPPPPRWETQALRSWTQQSWTQARSPWQVTCRHSMAPGSRTVGPAPLQLCDESLLQEWGGEPPPGQPCPHSRDRGLQAAPGAHQTDQLRAQRSWHSPAGAQGADGRGLQDTKR